MATLRLALVLVFAVASCGNPPADAGREDAAAARPELQPNAAPAGTPARIALAEIREAGHACPQIVVALRVEKDGSIIASCSNGVRYRVFSLEGSGTVAMNCNAAEELGIEDAC